VINIWKEPDSHLGHGTAMRSKVLCKYANTIHNKYTSCTTYWLKPGTEMLVIAFFYKHGVMHKKFVPEVTTLNNKFCVHMLVQ
jgi:hypothetical protein